jgi:hypothetical protein
MWTYTAYFLWRYFEKFPEKINKLELSELAEAILISLWKRSKIIFHVGMMDLYSDLEYLEKLRIISIQKSDKLEETKIMLEDEKRLRKIATDTREFSLYAPSNLLKEYIRRIDAAFA